MKARYLLAQVEADLARKMVLLGGPRQVGKTTLAKSLLKDASAYFCWDIPDQRAAILRRELPARGTVVLDELHKYRRWRNYLKGLYDERSPALHMLVTGSARLDFYRFGGDSLQGRYHYLRLHPFSVAELALRTPKDFDQLVRLGGFPEPFLSGSEAQARRWSREYRSRLVREEIVSLERVDDLGQLELLMLRLPDLVGSPLSINAIREDLELNHKTVARWLRIFENTYAIFRLSPFGPARVRAIKKAQKHYHFDWSLVQDPGARFENVVASHLLKWVHHVQDTEGRDLDLRYFRDVDGREVDFVVIDRRTPILFVEAKLGDSSPSPHLRYLKAKFPSVRAVQVGMRERRAFERDGIELCHAVDFLSELV